jgi:hypothetical protein
LCSWRLRIAGALRLWLRLRLYRRRSATETHLTQRADEIRICACLLQPIFDLRINPEIDARFPCRL